jgi:coenzyme F420-0:L-glutamate ligase/coenzyme F420-1:gamma-L-glutamate ligase
VSGIQLLGLEGIPEIHEGDQLASLIIQAAQRSSTTITAGSVLVVAQKIISKVEGRLIDLRDVEPSPFANALAASRQADPRLMELVLRESRRVVRMNDRVLITETHHGFVCANAGVDCSNLESTDYACLLPLNPDESARRLRTELESALGVELAVIITDTFGRPWREGLVNFAIGLAGLNPLNDLRETRDSHGRVLRATVLATADELAASAGLVMRKTKCLPVVLIKGFEYEGGEHAASELLRAKENDLFQ